MKVQALFVLTLLSMPLVAQTPEGFNKDEARDMIAICNSFTFIDLYNSDAEILPPGYKKVYTSGVFGMDNKFQIYEKGDLVVINLRGSTDKKVSWLENVYSAMIPATGVIKVSNETVPYKFAKDPAASVHSGYALAIAFLSKDLFYHINILHRSGIHRFIITGHSQGGALANMLRAFLENLSHDEIPKNISFETYAFAAPMVGNKEFTTEYDTRYCATHTSFNIVNPADLIPTFPLNYKDKNYLSDNLTSMLFDKESFSLRKMATDGAVLLFEQKIVGLTQMLGKSATNEISKEVGTVVMPPYVKEINYSKVGNVVSINPVPYPKILKDSSILKNDSLMAIYQRDKDGNFINETLYQKESWTFQHKPYNYYVSFLNMYFPKQYAMLKRKYLPETL